MRPGGLHIVAWLLTIGLMIAQIVLVFQSNINEAVNCDAPVDVKQRMQCALSGLFMDRVKGLSIFPLGTICLGYIMAFVHNPMAAASTDALYYMSLFSQAAFLGLISQLPQEQTEPKFGFSDMEATFAVAYAALITGALVKAAAEIPTSEEDEENMYDIKKIAKEAGNDFLGIAAAPFEMKMTMDNVRQSTVQMASIIFFGLSVVAITIAQVVYLYENFDLNQNVWDTAMEDDKRSFSILVVVSAVLGVVMLFKKNPSPAGKAVCDWLLYTAIAGEAVLGTILSFYTGDSTAGTATNPIDAEQKSDVMYGLFMAAIVSIAFLKAAIETPATEGGQKMEGAAQIAFASIMTVGAVAIAVVVAVYADTDSDVDLFGRIGDRIDTNSIFCSAALGITLLFMLVGFFSDEPDFRFVTSMVTDGAFYSAVATQAVLAAVLVTYMNAPGVFPKEVRNSELLFGLACGGFACTCIAKAFSELREDDEGRSSPEKVGGVMVRLMG